MFTKIYSSNTHCAVAYNLLFKSYSYLNVFAYDMLYLYLE